MQHKCDKMNKTLHWKFINCARACVCVCVCKKSTWKKKKSFSNAVDNNTLLLF